MLDTVMLSISALENLKPAEIIEAVCAHGYHDWNNVARLPDTAFQHASGKRVTRHESAAGSFYVIRSSESIVPRVVMAYDLDLVLGVPKA